MLKTWCWIGLVFMASQSVSANPSCQNISCDCDALPGEDWVEVCRAQEQRAQSMCERGKRDRQTYCTLHGPDANLLPLDLDHSRKSLIALEHVPQRNKMVAVMYWGVYKDLEKLQAQLVRHDFDEATLTFSAVERNISTLFDIQRQVGDSLSSGDQKAEAEAQWRHYAADSLAFNAELYRMAEKGLNDYATLAVPKHRDKAQLLAVRMMVLSGRAFEHIGHAYGEGERHKHAARAWKFSADAVDRVLAHAPGEIGNIDRLQLQASARLNRASYHWAMGEGHGSAAESVAVARSALSDGTVTSFAQRVGALRPR